MLSEAKLSTYFWVEAINIACYTQSRTLSNKLYGCTPYHLITGKKPTARQKQVFYAQTHK